MNLGILIYVFFIFAVLIKATGKNKKKSGTTVNSAAQRQAARPSADHAASQPGHPQPRAQAATAAKPERDLYAGSMNAHTGEGEDPCHEKELHPVRETTRQEDHPVAEENGSAPLMDWQNRDEVVRAFIMQTVLERPRDRQHRR